MEKIKKGQCEVTGYRRQSLKCANCRFNRVDNEREFVDAQKTDNKTAGTYCIKAPMNNQ